MKGSDALKLPDSIWSCQGPEQEAEERNCVTCLS